MSSQAERVLEDALKLSEKDRADLAVKLLDSLDADSEEGIQDAWNQEIERRLDELDQGKVTAIPWEEARRSIGNDSQ